MKKIFFKAVVAIILMLVVASCDDSKKNCMVYDSSNFLENTYCKSGKISVEITAFCRYSEIPNDISSLIMYYLSQKTELDLISEPEKSAQELTQLLKEKRNFDCRNLMIAVKPSEKMHKLFGQLQESRIALEIAQNYYLADSLKTARAKMDAIGYSEEAKTLEQMRDKRAEFSSKLASEERKQKMRSDAIKNKDTGWLSGSLTVNQ